MMIRQIYICSLGYAITRKSTDWSAVISGLINPIAKKYRSVGAFYNMLHRFTRHRFMRALVLWQPALTYGARREILGKYGMITPENRGK